MWPTININQLNLLQGESKEISRVVLFVGEGSKNTGKTLSVNTQTNLDTLLGSEPSILKSNLNAALLNAGQNWSAYVRVLAEGESKDPQVVAAAVLEAQRVASVEGVVLLCDITQAEMIHRATALRNEIMAKFARWQWFMISVAGAKDTTDWATYLDELSGLQQGIAAPGVMLVPRLYGNEPGVLAGRLCNQTVTIADTPARVKTGPLVDLGSNDVVDLGGVALGLDTLQALEKLRFSVPMWYPDYAGKYWSDGRTLDVEGGDFQSIEKLRIIDKAAREVRLIAIPKLGDRSFNSTPHSIERHISYFEKPLRAMSKTVRINNEEFPGDIMPPQKGDIVISWASERVVSIYITIRLYNCPLNITVNLMLDASVYGES